MCLKLDIIPVGASLKALALLCKYSLVETLSILLCAVKNGYAKV